MKRWLVRLMVVMGLVVGGASVQAGLFSFFAGKSAFQKGKSDTDFDLDFVKKHLTKEGFQSAGHVQALADYIFGCLVVVPRGSMFSQQKRTAMTMSQLSSLIQELKNLYQDSMLKVVLSRSSFYGVIDQAEHKSEHKTYFYTLLYDLDRFAGKAGLPQEGYIDQDFLSFLAVPQDTNPLLIPSAAKPTTIAEAIAYFKQRLMVQQANIKQLKLLLGRLKSSVVMQHISSYTEDQLADLWAVCEKELDDLETKQKAAMKIQPGSKLEYIDFSENERLEQMLEAITSRSGKVSKIELKSSSDREYRHLPEASAPVASGLKKTGVFAGVARMLGKKRVVKFDEKGEKGSLVEQNKEFDADIASGESEVSIAQTIDSKNKAKLAVQSEADAIAAQAKREKEIRDKKLKAGVAK